MGRGGYHGAGPPLPALVLGCNPGRCQERRARAAGALWAAEPIDRVVVSGAGEAASLAARCRAHGVPSEAILLEPRARTTRENLVEARALLGPGPLWLVTDDWHLPRALRLARRVGLTPRPWPTGDGWTLETRIYEAVSWSKAALRGHL